MTRFMSRRRAQPVVPANDWSVLRVPPLGATAPRRAVSVVMPAHDPTHLPQALAALAAQSYPEHLLEVVVVDDGSNPPVQLPPVRPSRTRVVRVTEGWGRARACHVGVESSDGEVIHWLDADVVLDRHEVEAQLRWHHVVDYAVVLGARRFTDGDGLDHLDPPALHAAVAAGADPAALSHRPVQGYWTDKFETETAALTSAGPRAMRAHLGMSATVGADLYRESGGMPVDLHRGEDIVLGYRLREVGAVFIPDADARCLHLGHSGVMRAADTVNHYNKPHIMQKVPEFRGHRLRLPRSYEVPYLEVLIPAATIPYDVGRRVVDHLLAGGVPDSTVTLLGPWGSLADDRRDVLSDTLVDLRLLREAYRFESRVRLAERPGRSPATFRLSIDALTHVPGHRSVVKLLHDLEARHLGGARVTDRGRRIASLTRTAAIARAERAGATVDEAYPMLDLSPDAAGFEALAAVRAPRQIRGVMPYPR